MESCAVPGAMRIEVLQDEPCPIEGHFRVGYGEPIAGAAPRVAPGGGPAASDEHDRRR